VPETYVHRIGRTARAGASGIAISMCSGEEREFLDDIERLIGREIERVGGEPPARGAPHPRPGPTPPHRGRRRGGSRGRRSPR